MVRRAVVLLAIGAVGIQLVPYGWRKSNPAVVADAPWPDPAARRVAQTSCYDCHSNVTNWPAYSYVAPMSWLVRRDVDAGRDELNFSEWDRDAGKADDAVETILDGSMPPRRYTLAHRGASLSDDEERVLVAALERMAVSDDGRGRGGRGRSRYGAQP